MYFYTKIKEIFSFLREISFEGKKRRIKIKKLELFKKKKNKEMNH